MDSRVFFRVLPKVLYHGINKMRFIWHRDNGKVDSISRSQFKLCLSTSAYQFPRLTSLVHKSICYCLSIQNPRN